MHQRSVTLTAAQRAELEQVRDRDRRAYLRECAAAILKIADGQSAHAVARAGLLKRRKPDTVYTWLNKFARQGIAGLVHLPSGHRGFSPSGGRTTRRDGPTNA